jgi:hypothetical protein
VADAQHRLSRDPDGSGLLGEQVERDVDRSLEGVLDRDQRELDAAVA